MARVKVLFNGPGTKANGLAAAPDGLWVCDQVEMRIYKVRYEDGSVLTTFDSPAVNLSGCGYGGGLVWGAANRPPNGIAGHDPATGWCKRYLVLPTEGGIHGLEWLDGALWVTRPGRGTIQKIDPQSAAVLHEIPFPERRSHGVFFKDGLIVVNDTNSGTVYHMDMSDGRVVRKWTVEDFEIHGMTLGPDGRVWFCDAETNRIGVAEGD